MSWKRSPHPDMNVISKLYSPSAGKEWRTLMPPRVPNGAPSTRSHSCWETVGGFVYVTAEVAASRSPTVRRATSLAAFR